MDSNNSKFAELIKNCETQPLYFLTNEDKELVNLLCVLRGNRPIRNDRVNGIVKAIQEGTYIPPILVAVPSRQVIEGNHRLTAMQACLKQNIPFKIGMITCKDIDALETARVINNTQMRWSANNRLHSYCVEGKESFARLRGFMDSNSEFLKKKEAYKITSTLALFTGTRSFDGLKTSFYSGTLTLKQNEWDLAELALQELKIVQDILPNINVFSDFSVIGWIRAKNALSISTTEIFKKLRKKASKIEEPKKSKLAWFDLYTHIAMGI